MSYRSKSTPDTVSRTIRFKPADLELIDAFLDQNPIFDFSSLTRTAIMAFIQNPTVQITAITPEKARALTSRRAAPRKDA